MKQILTVKGLVDFAYNKYKSKNAATIDKGYIKDINYFNYRFDIYSLARAINSKIKNKRIAIISESRYEFFVTYLANIMLRNTIIVIDSNLSQNSITKIIKKFYAKLKLINKALLTFSISLSVICPIFSFNLLLSKVLICSNKTTESLLSPYSSDDISTCVGSFALFIWEVIAEIITVGLYLFPILFCMIITGLIPPCSDPTTGLRSA